MPRSRSKPTKKKQSKKRAVAARSSKRSARKAPARQARKAAPRRVAKPKRAASKAKSTNPVHQAHTEEVRAAVARRRPTPAGASHAETQAEHDHQDPRLAGIPGVSHEGNKVQVENYGQFKNKAVPRLDKPVNWFRRGAKPKQ